MTYQTYIKRERYLDLSKGCFTFALLCFTFPDGSRQFGSWEVPQDIEAHTLTLLTPTGSRTFRGNGIVYLPQILDRNKLCFASIL